MQNRVKLDLQKAELRIAELEAIICPDGHDWLPDITNKKHDKAYRCFRCNKKHYGTLPTKEEK